MAPKRTVGSNAKVEMKRKAYEQELRKLQVELCHLQDWASPVKRTRDWQGDGTPQKGAPHGLGAGPVTVGSRRSQSCLSPQRVKQLPGPRSALSTPLIEPRTQMILNASLFGRSRPIELFAT